MNTTAPSSTATRIELAGRGLPLLDRARIYACGVTPYDVTHLGHAATFVWVDTLARVLRRFFGVIPVVSRNVTDIDDVLDAAAHRAGTRPDAFAAFQQFLFEGDMSALQVWSPDHQPWAHRYVHAVIRLAAALIDTGTAYQRAGSVYFRGHDPPANRPGPGPGAAVGRRVRRPAGRPGQGRPVRRRHLAGYRTRPPVLAVAMGRRQARLARRMRGDGGVGVRPQRRHPCRRRRPGLPPSRLPLRHGRGLHRRERPYARAWFHVGTVTIDGAKMAKSAGNLVLLTTLLADHPAAVVRLMILDRPWAKSWDYHPAQLHTAANRLRHLHRAAAHPVTSSPADVDHLRHLLASELDLPAALDHAIDVGGDTARQLIATLGLT